MTTKPTSSAAAPVVQHSPLPWRRENIPERRDAPLRIESADGDRVAQLSRVSMTTTDEECEANLAFIILAANCHDDLLAACKRLLAAHSIICEGDSHDGMGEDDDCKAARAAIAKAGGAA